MGYNKYGKTGINKMVTFIHRHPHIALMILHHNHKLKVGGIIGSGAIGGSWKSFWKGVKKTGKNVTSSLYKGAEKFYDYTNGLPAKAIEGVSKKVFHTDLNKYATYRDAKKAYSYATGDPRKYKELFNASTHPTDTYNKLKGYIKPAVVGLVTGGPVGAVQAVGTQRVREDVYSDLSKMGDDIKGRGVYSSALGFFNNNIDKAKRILKLVENNKKKPMSKRTKNILKSVGAVGIAGSLAFLGWAQNTPTSHTFPKLDHTLPDDAWLGYGLNTSGDGLGEIKNFLIKNKTRAISVLLGLATIGSTVAGESLFRKKYGGIATTTSDGMRIIKHLLSGSDKKLEVGNIMLRGSDVVHIGSGVHLAGYGLSPAGDGLSPTGGALRPAGNGLNKVGGSRRSIIKNALSVAGAAGVAGAISFANWYLGKTYYDDGVDDDWGAISSEQHNLLFGEGDDLEGARTFANVHPLIAKKIAKYLDKYKTRGRGRKKTTRRGIKPRHKKIGNKVEVYGGGADRTSGGLRKSDLCLNKRGKVVSIKQMRNGINRMKHLRMIKNKKSENN